MRFEDTSRSLGLTDENAAEILHDAEFRAEHETAPLSPADRSILCSELTEVAFTSIMRWFESSRGYSPRTYANTVMNVHQPKIVAKLLAQQKNELTILDAPVDTDDPDSPLHIDKVADHYDYLVMSCLPRCDWEMVIEFFTREELHIFEARLHNVPRDVIRRELNYTRGVWHRVWRRFQCRAAFILDLEK